MNADHKLYTASLFTLGLLSIISGMLIVEVLLLVDYMPAWTNLLGFFAAGVMYKFILLLHRYKGCQRVVTVEVDFFLFHHEVKNNGYQYHYA